MDNRIIIYILVGLAVLAISSIGLLIISKFHRSIEDKKPKYINKRKKQGYIDTPRYHYNEDDEI